MRVELLECRLRIVTAISDLNCNDIFPEACEAGFRGVVVITSA